MTLNDFIKQYPNYLHDTFVMDTKEHSEKLINMVVARFRWYDIGGTEDEFAQNLKDTFNEYKDLYTELLVNYEKKYDYSIGNKKHFKYSMNISRANQGNTLTTNDLASTNELTTSKATTDTGTISDNGTDNTEHTGTIKDEISKDGTSVNSGTNDTAHTGDTTIHKSDTNKGISSELPNKTLNNTDIYTAYPSATSKDDITSDVKNTFNNNDTLTINTNTHNSETTTNTKTFNNKDNETINNTRTLDTEENENGTEKGKTTNTGTIKVSDTTNGTTNNEMNTETTYDDEWLDLKVKYMKQIKNIYSDFADEFKVCFILVYYVGRVFL